MWKIEPPICLSLWLFVCFVLSFCCIIKQCVSDAEYGEFKNSVIILFKPCSMFLFWTKLCILFLPREHSQHLVYSFSQGQFANLHGCFTAVSFLVPSICPWYSKPHVLAFLSLSHNIQHPQLEGAEVWFGSGFLSKFIWPQSRNRTAEGHGKEKDAQPMAARKQSRRTMQGRKGRRTTYSTQGHLCDPARHIQK